MDQEVSLSPSDKSLFISWCAQEAKKYRAFADASSRCTTQVATLVSQGTGLATASLEVVSVLLGGDPVPAPPPEPAQVNAPPPPPPTQ